MYSKIKITNSFLDIFPNPSDGSSLNIRLRMEKSLNPVLKVFNSMGQQVSEIQIRLYEGINTIQFNRLVDLQRSGLYTMKIYGNNEILEKKFIIQ